MSDAEILKPVGIYQLPTDAGVVRVEIPMVLSDIDTEIVVQLLEMIIIATRRRSESRET